MVNSVQGVSSARSRTRPRFGIWNLGKLHYMPDFYRRQCAAAPEARSVLQYGTLNP